MTISNLPEATTTDWAFCQQSLAQVSRTFAQPIQFLPEKQMRALTVGYLLCRVADTIEDSLGLSLGERDELYDRFLDVLSTAANATQLAQRLAQLEASEAEISLGANLDRVMNVFVDQDATVRQATIRWVTEMTHGMRLYSHRSASEGFCALINMNDLERYCYYVAGTVGHLITDLFDDATEKSGLEAKLRDHAESFGLGLQMVNIVKDVTDDFERGVCYVPRQVCRSEGFEPEQLLEPCHRAAAKRAVAKLILRAEMHLDEAFEYTLKIPREHHHLRLFCLLPLWMAVETLAHARDNDAVFVPGEKVKISRETVAKIIADCGRDCRDDEALRAGFHKLKTKTVPVAVIR